ncbi:Uma2 family endonuclease [Actinoplanes sp. NPDC049802]|uniref:Uma2 family endonuclease n=1 Tax=Actinoplanes sp. NPDC049802 TaxID=3154742 RepID=UPI0034093875
MDGLAAMAAADEHHRYEMTSDGQVMISPIGDPAVAAVVSRLAMSLLRAYGSERVVVHLGIDFAEGGVRVPDISLWDHLPRASRAGYVGTEGLRLIAEVRQGSDPVGWLDRGAVYAAAGVPSYWVIDQGDTKVAHRHLLDAGGTYRPHPSGPVPIDRLLATAPNTD